MSELKAITELVVYRDLWVRGGTDNATEENLAGLLNSDGMCCLGFASLAIGVPPTRLCGLGEPVQILVDRTEIPGLVHCNEGEFQHTPMTDAAMEINDNENIDDPEREAELIGVFAADGIALTFEDTAPDDLRAAYEEGLGR